MTLGCWLLQSVLEPGEELGFVSRHTEPPALELDPEIGNLAIREVNKRWHLCSVGHMPSFNPNEEDHPPQVELFPVVSKVSPTTEKGRSQGNCSRLRANVRIIDFRCLQRCGDN